MKIDLNGLWEFCIDLGACGANYPDSEFPRDDWDIVEVPGCWNFYAEKYKFYEGVVWYAKEFFLDRTSSGTKATLYFEGVNYLCEVYLNGEKIGNHEGGYTPFSFDVSEKLKEGKNILVVKVDNRRHLLRMPFVVGWFNYGGIHRPVSLHISETGQTKKSILKTEEEKSSPLEIKGNKIFSNGKELKLKGINYLPINPAGGLTYSKEMIRTDLELLRELGVNCIRIHFPISEEFFTECDKSGLMVWCDIPVYCLEAYAGVPEDFFLKEENYLLAEQYLEETYFAYQHHPSIIAWSLGNENSTWLPGANEFFKRLIETARSLEKNRLLSYASLALMRREEEGFFGGLDIIGLNEYFGWYDRLGKNYGNWRGDKPDLKILEDKLKEFFARHNKPVVITEFGADSLPNYRSSDLALGSEDYQAALLEENFRIFKQFPQIVGYFPFSLNDYPDPSKSLVKFWYDEMNHKGVVSFKRGKKYSFEVLKKIYKEG